MKYILILALTLLGYSHSKAQIKPCISYNANRTMDQFSDSILSGKRSFIWKKLWPEYARLGNMALQTSKDSSVRAIVLYPDFTSMEWLMRNSKLYDESFFDWKDFRNAGRENNELVYTNSKGTSSPWVVLKYKDVEQVYAKSACANAQDPKEYKPFTPPAPIVCENKLKVIIHKFVDENNNPIPGKMDYSQLIGDFSQTCKNIVDTTIMIEKSFSQKKAEPEKKVLNDEKEEHVAPTLFRQTPYVESESEPDPEPVAKKKGILDNVHITFVIGNGGGRWNSGPPIRNTYNPDPRTMSSGVGPKKEKRTMSGGIR